MDGDQRPHRTEEVVSRSKVDVIIRADADAQIGSGHVLRCLALAEAIQETGGSVVFAARCLPDGIRERLKGSGFGVTEITGADDIFQTIELARESDANWIVLDGYQFGAAAQREIKAAGLQLLVLDDYGQAEEYCADFILNQNIQAEPTLYQRRAAGTQLLLGTRYSLLRREFRAARQSREVPERAERLLVTCGGGDAPNMTGRVLEAIDELPVETRVIVGPSNPHLADLEARAARQESVSIRRNPPDLPEQMQWADLAVSAAGSTCWELAYMGVPQMLLVLAENQRPSAERLDTEKIACNLGWHDAITPQSIRAATQRLIHDRETRTAMAGRGSRLVDGQGARRVCLEMRMKDLRFRPVRADESQLIFEWANDPATRAASFTADPISWETHSQWMAGKLASPTTCFLIAEDAAHEPLGQIRFEIRDAEAVISVSLAPRHRGRGWASALVLGSCRWLFDHKPVETVIALVKPDNLPSCRAFLRADFEAGEPTKIGRQAAASFHLRRARA